MAISHEGVFGNGSYEQRLMPIVFIDKITLENNSIPPTPTDNPHIVDTIKDLQALEGIGLQGSLLYEKATVQTGPSGCYVTINMIVKDIIENSSLSSWFYDAELLKYMQIRIIQSTDKNLTSSLISGKFAVLEKPESEGLFQEQILTLSQYYESTKDFYSIDETGRNNIASIPYEAKFYLDEAQPQNLAYFAYCYFDIQSLAADYSLDMYGYSMRQGIVSQNITSEMVIQGGSIVSQSYIFYTPEGDVWAGAVHQHNGQWMAGASHTASPHPILRRETVINSTIQDFRDIDSYERELNLAPLEGFVGRTVDQGSAAQVSITDRPAYFSDAFVSRRTDPDTSRTVSDFVFSFDFKEFIRQESQMGSLFSLTQNIEAQEKMFRLSKILSLKIYRYRADPKLSFNKLNTPVKGGKLKINAYDGSEEAPVLIVDSADELTGRLKSKTNDSGSIREVNLRGTDGIRSYAVSDKSIGELTDGHYQYEVEIQVQDGTVDYLNTMLIQLSEAKDALSLYYNLSTSPEYYDAKTNRFKPEFLQSYLVNNPKANFANAPWVIATSRLAYATMALTDITALEPTPLDISNMHLQLFSVANPTTGSPKGIYGVLSLIEKMETTLISYLGDQKATAVDRKSTAGVETSTFEKFILRDTQMFSGLVDSEISPGYGLKFLPEGNQNSFSGPQTILFSNYYDRIVEENNKYFISAGSADLGSEVSEEGESPDEVGEIPAELRDLSSYGATYLTPRVALDNANTLTMTGDLLSSLSKYERFSVPLLVKHMRKRGTATPVSAPWQKGLQSNELLGELGVTVESVYDAKGVVKVGYASSIDVLGDESLFVAEDIDYSKQIHGVSRADLSQMSKLFCSDLTMMQDTRFFPEVSFTGENSIDQLRIGCFSSHSECSLLEKYRMLPSSDLDTDKLLKIPNQIKSLFLSMLTSVVKNNWAGQDVDVCLSPETALMFIWNYQNIAKVEYLSGYANASAEGYQTRAPIWSDLTFSVLRQYASEDASIQPLQLCRLVPYVDTNFNIGVSQYAQMPYQGSYFVIASDQKSAQSTVLPMVPVAMEVSYREMINTSNRWTTQLTKIGESSSYLNSVPEQKPAQNDNGDADSSYKDPFGSTVTSTVQGLLNEMSICTAAIPAYQADEYDEQESYDDGATEDVPDGDPNQEDNFDYNPNDEPGNEPEDETKDTVEGVDYDDTVNAKKDDLVNYVISTSEDSNGMPTVDEEQKNLITQWVEETYGVGDKKSEDQAETESAASLDVGQVNMTARGNVTRGGATTTTSAPTTSSPTPTGGSY
tara:strand:+ start:3313 stop:7176 length:3864 start_codon:yes stop_codon:yes gene_type:complete